MNGQQQLQERVDALAKELPGITFGYIGNVEQWCDDRSWFVFLPHPGRVGRYNDSVRIGTTAQLEVAVAGWPRVQERVRRLYPLGDCGRKERSFLTL